MIHNPPHFGLTAGQRNDVTQVPTLSTGRDSDSVIADQAYHATSLIEQIEALGALPVIPARKSWREPRYYDQHLYRERHVAECCVNKLKWHMLMAIVDGFATSFRVLIS